jgi:hypothetical protein
MIMTAEGRGPLLHARVGMLRTMNHGGERVLRNDRKKTHWDRRKLKRDECKAALPGTAQVRSHSEMLGAGDLFPVESGRVSFLTTLL